MRAVVLAIALSAVAASANAETLQVAGQAGHLGEWELTANVTAEMQGGKKQFAGPLVMKHVGICSVDGPEEKTGQIKFQMTGAASRIKATLVIEGKECTFAGVLSATHQGTMECRDGAPLPVSLWVQ